MRAFIGSLLLCASSIGMAGDIWSQTTTLQMMVGDYVSCLTRNNLNSVGVIHAVDYRDRAGFALGWEYSHVDFAAVPNTFFTSTNIYGSNYYASGKVNFFPAKLPGKLTAKLDLYYVDNQDPSDFSDEVKVWSPQLLFLNHAKTFYLDLGYAHSRYKVNLDMQQYTPTVGFGFNQGYEWVQLRGFLITPSNPSRVQGTRHTKALDTKWIHYFQPGHRLKPANVQLGYLWGKRIQAVDHDAASVYSLTDLQKDSMSLAAVWNLPRDFSLMLYGSRTFYRQRTLGDNYSSLVAYMNIAKKW